MSDADDKPPEFDPVAMKLHLDNFVNAVTLLGTTTGDKTRGGLPGGPAFQLYKMSFPEAEARYRGSDLGRAIVDKPVEEMFRRGWDVEVQPSDDEQEIAADPRAKLDAARREPLRAAAGWRKVARTGRLDGAQRSAARERARRWDLVAAGVMPAAAAPPPPPGPLPKINDAGMELGEASEKWSEKIPTNCGRGAAGVIAQAMRYERAFGGGCVFIGVDEGDGPSGVELRGDNGHRLDARDPRNLAAPLDLSRVRKVTHLTALRGGADGVVTMWRPYRFATRPKFGLPEIYQVTNSTVPIAGVPAPGELLPPEQYPVSPSGPTLFYVHESRFLVFDGEPTSIEARQEMRGWGDSIFTRVNDPLMQFEQGWQAVGLLMQEASTADVGIEGFTRALAEKGVAARDSFVLYAQLQSLMRSVARTNYHDAKETFKRETVSFAGLADLLDRQVDRIAAAAGTPVSVLFGNLKGGLGAKEDPSSRGWYATTEARQESRLREPLEYLYRIGFHSKEGPTRGKEPEKWALLFRPLWQLTELEQADLRLKTSQADASDIDKQVITPEEVAATRYGGAEYNAGCIVLDMDARTTASEPGAPATRAPTGGPPNGTAVPPKPPNGQALPATSSQAAIPPLRTMPTDPITAQPTGTPTALGETGNGVPAGTPGSGRGDQLGGPFGRGSEDAQHLDEYLRAALTLDGHEDQPRDEKGRFAASGAAGAAVAKSIAEHLTSRGIAATHEGGSVKLARGTIEIGKHGERTYKGATANAQNAAELHLASGPKHVAAWAARTSPPAAKARLAAERAARAAAPKTQAPRNPKGKVDQPHVPGAGRGYQVVTTNSKDPEKGYRGRSFNCKSAEDMKAEWLAASAGGGRGTNGSIVQNEVGGTLSRGGGGGARDRAQFDAVREMYKGSIRGAEKVETFDQAFKVLAQASAQAAGNRNGAPSWRHFDLETLRSCRGFEHAEIPGWVHEAQAARAEAEHVANYYDHHGGEGGPSSGGGGDDDVPF